MPGGGYNSDQQAPPLINACQDPHVGDVRDNVTYTRTIELAASDLASIPRSAALLLEFGAVNHGASVFVDGKLVGRHYGPAMPFAVDDLYDGSAECCV